MVWNQPDAFWSTRRTLFNWKRAFKQGGGKPEAAQSQEANSQKQTKRRSWDWRIRRRLKDLETETSTNLGAEKLHPLLLDFAILSNLNVGSPTIERIIKDLGSREFVLKKYISLCKVKKANRQKVLKTKGFQGLASWTYYRSGCRGKAKKRPKNVF